MKNSIFSDELFSLFYTEKTPILIDVRRLAAFQTAERIIPTAYWRDHLTADDWAKEISREKEVIIYCAHGEQVSQSAVALLKNKGIHARYLAGGIDAWESAGGTTLAKAQMIEYQDKYWVTRENPTIDRIVCPWLIRRFIDSAAMFQYVDEQWVKQISTETGAIIFDINAPNVDFSHDGEFCSFDAFIQYFNIRDAALNKMAKIVRGADTNRLDLAPEAAGLLAFSLGLSAIYQDDLEMLEKGMLIYDALYSFCRNAIDKSNS